MANRTPQDFLDTVLYQAPAGSYLEFRASGSARTGENELLRSRSRTKRPTTGPHPEVIYPNVALGVTTCTQLLLSVSA